MVTRPPAAFVFLFLVGVLSMPGCATYAPKPLPRGPSLALKPASLVVDLDKLKRPVPGLKPHVLDFADSLDMTEVVMLAVLNNPGLKAVRARGGIARAQLFAAGLLPDPQLNLSFDHPTAGPSPLTNAFGLGLSADLQALITRGAARAAQAQAARQVDLEVLWREWQVAQQARLLVVRGLASRQLLQVARTAQNFLAQRYAQSSESLEQGDVTLDVVAADLLGLTDADTRLRDIERELNRTQHNLAALLGLAPDTGLALVESQSPQPFPPRQLDSALRELARRRPDLVALQAGYRSQDYLLRQAILTQFPSLSVSFNRARDTGDVSSIGFGITIGLPLFNRNRGEIAIQRATRAQLRAEYQARLDGAVVNAHLAWMNVRLLSRQLRAARARLPALAAMTAKARRGFDAGALDPLIFITLQTNLLAKRSEAVRLEQSLREAQVGLETLLGITLDPRWMALK